MEMADFAFPSLSAWDDKLVDLSDVIEPAKDRFISTALPCCNLYNNVTKTRSYYVAPMKIFAVPFHMEIAGREGRVQSLGYAEHLGCVSRFLQAGPDQVT
jgi:hypothetical protein